MGWTRDYVFLRFKDAVRHVWSNADFVLPRLAMSDEEPAGGYGASLAHARSARPWAIRDSLIRIAPLYTLRVSNKLLERMNDDELWGALVHEAVHIGHGGHGREFRDLVVAKGGLVTGADAEEGTGVIEVQRKFGSRYKTVRTFPLDQEDEAKRWAHEQAEAGRSGGQDEKWRLRW